MITIPEMEKLPTNCHECPICFTPWPWNDEDEYWCAWMPLPERYKKDEYPEMPGQFDNMTGSMNLHP